MASKGAPKKLYAKSSTPEKNISRCRLCNSVQDPKRCKYLFGSANKLILQHTESIHDINQILSSLLQFSYHQEKKVQAKCLIYSIIMLLRCHEVKLSSKDKHHSSYTRPGSSQYKYD